MRISLGFLLLCTACGQAGGFRIDGAIVSFDGPGTVFDAGELDPADAGENLAEAGMTTDGSTLSASMSFFATSSGNGANGGNFGGLDGADQKCESHANAVGLGGKTWRAYLGSSDTVTGGALIHPRDRIGGGPWRNYLGQIVAQNIDALHANGLDSNLIYDENGQRVPIAEHDIMTGADETGMTRSGDTCANWTDGSDAVTGFVGHWDWSLPESQGERHWISSHRVLGCSAAQLATSLGSARIYCFAVD